jgi:ABC-type lipoprotein release transport system permease subunit
LFLGFSFFLIAAAVMLIALLFQLGVEQRAGELGTLAAVGMGRRRIARLLGREGLVVAAIGAAVGVAAGVLYAWLITLGLRTWWVAAIATPFMELHVTPRSLVLGWLIGVVISWLTIRWSIRRLVRRPASRLLAGSIAGEPRSPEGRGRIWPAIRVALLLAIAALVSIGFRLQGEAQAGVFFGSGAAMLALLLGEIRSRLRDTRIGSDVGRTFSLSRLSALNTSRNPGRSTLTIGLVAAASFLIIAVSAFRLDTGEGGTGGFDYLANSDRPIHYDLTTPAGRRELGFTDEENAALEFTEIYAFRVADGENASCLNLYRPTQPRVLGVPEAFIARGGVFKWAATSRHPAWNEWRTLSRQYTNEKGDAVIPVVLDKNTAVYSLHLKGIGSQLIIRDAADQPVKLEVVGLLDNSVLQGNLLIREEDFLKLFPDAGGYRFFLIRDRKQHVPHTIPGTPPGTFGVEIDSARRIPTMLESKLAEEGFDVVDAREQLAAFLAVQNTYLSTFQSLGALGLLLGTVGLAVVQLRSVLERRGELALMRAAGFRRSRLVGMVIFENAVLLIGGLVVGFIAAAVALVPQWAPQSASVPWRALAVLLATIVVTGLVAGWLATRSALRASIVPALRGD